MISPFHGAKTEPLYRQFGACGVVDQASLRTTAEMTSLNASVDDGCV